jgi:hypothetical protein
MYFRSSDVLDVPTPFNDSVFVDKFSQSFLNFALAKNPNVKWDPSNTVPHWDSWTEEGNTEMVFNKTVKDVPVFASVRTARTLLKRCE